jgi:hypothetical protein
MTPEQAQRLIHGELSKRARVSHAVLLVGALAMGCVVASIWATESGLPMRTHVAFFALVLIAAGWTTYSAWMLTRRVVLLVPHQVRAAQLALASTLVFFGGGLVLWALSELPAAPWAALSGLVMVLIAGVQLQRARAHHAALLQRRDALVLAKEGGRS